MVSDGDRPLFPCVLPVVNYDFSDFGFACDSSFSGEPFLRDAFPPNAWRGRGFAMPDVDCCSSRHPRAGGQSHAVG